MLVCICAYDAHALLAHRESPTVTRSMLWLSVLRADTPMQLTFILDGNAWATPEQRADGGWLQTVEVAQWQTEVTMLMPSLLPAFTDMAVRHDPVAVVVAARLLQQRISSSTRAANNTAALLPVTARGWTETCSAETNSSGLCAHIVAVNTARSSPAAFTLHVRLPLPAANTTTTTVNNADGAARSRVFPTVASRIFGSNGGYDIPVECWPGTDCTEGELVDYVPFTEE